MLGHLRHSRILAALILLLQLLIVQGLLLLFLSHVATVGSRSRYASSCGRHLRHVVGGSNIISSIDTVFITRGLWSVQACLMVVRGLSPNQRLWTYLDQILALGLGDKWLKLRSGECVDQASLGNNQKKDLSASEDGEFVGL